MNRYLLGPFVVLLVLLMGGLAYAATFTCASGSTDLNPCQGTSNPDTITGTTGNDVIKAGAGGDTVNAAQGGTDSINGGKGDDTIDVHDGAAGDTVSCDDGASDKVSFDTGDTVAASCENSGRSEFPIGPPPPPPPTDVTCPAGGINVTPSQDLAAVAANNSGSKTYCLAPGTYTVSQNIKVEGADKFLGLSTDPTQVKVKSIGTQSYGASGAFVTDNPVTHVFETGSSNGATFENLDISGGVHDNTCEPNCGRGIGSGGSNITVRNAKIHDNENAGIGATGPGLKVFNTEIFHNGNVDSARDGGPVSAAGIKSSNGGSYSVFDSNVHDNYWTGLWCDIDCGAFEVHDSNVSNNGKAGIHDEISTGPAIFEGNTIKNNGGLSTANQHTGLLIVSSTNAEAFGNTFGGNVSEGVKLMEDSRPPVLGNIRIHDNTMNGDSLTGCSLAGVTCTNNT